MLLMQTLVNIKGLPGDYDDTIVEKLPVDCVHDYWRDTDRGGMSLWIVHPYVDTDDHGAHVAVDAIRQIVGHVVGHGDNVTAPETLVWAPDGVTWEVAEKLRALDVVDAHQDLVILQAHAREQADAAMSEFLSNLAALGIKL